MDATTIQQAADDAIRLANQFKALANIGNVLREIGAVAGHRAELERDVAKLTEAKSRLVSETEKFNTDLAALKTTFRAEFLKEKAAQDERLATLASDFERIAADHKERVAALEDERQRFEAAAKAARLELAKAGEDARRSLRVIAGQTDN